MKTKVGIICDWLMDKWFYVFLIIFFLSIPAAYFYPASMIVRDLYPVLKTLPVIAIVFIILGVVAGVVALIMFSLSTDERTEKIKRIVFFSIIPNAAYLIISKFHCIIYFVIYLFVWLSVLSILTIVKNTQFTIFSGAIRNEKILNNLFRSFQAEIIRWGQKSLNEAQSEELNSYVKNDKEIMKEIKTISKCEVKKLSYFSKVLYKEAVEFGKEDGIKINSLEDALSE